MSYDSARDFLDQDAGPMPWDTWSDWAFSAAGCGDRGNRWVNSSEAWEAFMRGDDPKNPPPSDWEG